MPTVTYNLTKLLPPTIIQYSSNTYSVFKKMTFLAFKKGTFLFKKGCVPFKNSLGKCPFSKIKSCITHYSC